MCMVVDVSREDRASECGRYGDMWASSALRLWQRPRATAHAGMDSGTFFAAARVGAW